MNKFSQGFEYSVSLSKNLLDRLYSVSKNAKSAQR